LSYSGFDEVPVYHLPEMEKCWKVNLIRQSHLENLKSLKMVLCPSCDGVPLKFKKKNGGPPVHQHTLFELSFAPS
jgi:hypothetical protein